MVSKLVTREYIVTYPLSQKIFSKHVTDKGEINNDLMMLLISVDFSVDFVKNKEASLVTKLKWTIETNSIPWASMLCYIVTHRFFLFYMYFFLKKNMSYLRRLKKKDNNCIYICLLNRLKIALLMTWYTWNKYAVVSFSSINPVPSQAQRPPWRSSDLLFYFSSQTIHPRGTRELLLPPPDTHGSGKVFPAIGCLPGGPHVNELRCQDPAPAAGQDANVMGADRVRRRHGVRGARGVGVGVPLRRHRRHPLRPDRRDGPLCLPAVCMSSSSVSTI